ncbi:MAG: four helix bundle protein [Chloroflexi bacterium]|nr:four helix bundle protein [Chloroflexota bacterium]
MAVFNSYEEWLEQVPESIKQDPLWNFQVYLKALFLSDLAWKDTDKVIKDPRGNVIAKQLIRSVGSICANIEEGHGRGFGKDNAYFQRVALGSARESRGWYYRGRRFLDSEVFQHRLRLLDEIIAALVLSSEQQRKYRKR